MNTAAHADAPARAPLHHDALAGPGWYESSWELLCGLDVREVSFAECRYGGAGGGAEPDPPSAT